MDIIQATMQALKENESGKEREEITIGKDKRYVVKDSDLAQQLKAIKRTINHLEQYVSFIEIDNFNEEGLEKVKVEFGFEGFNDFAYVIAQFDPNNYGTIQDLGIHGSVIITKELLDVCEELYRIKEHKI